MSVLTHIAAILRRSAADAELDVHIPPAVVPAELDRFESETGLALPVELKGLYSECNGAGMVDGDQPVWFIHPLHEILDFAESISAGMQASNSKFAERCLFFGDWFNGDGFGYVKDDREGLARTIHQWDHETGECEDTQATLVEFLQWLAEDA